MAAIRDLGAVALAALALAVCPAGANAAAWTGPVQVTRDGSPAAIGIDDAGAVTVLYYDSQRRPFVATRRPGAAGFGPPAAVAPAWSQTQLAVAPSGRVVVVYAESPCPCPATGGLWYRAGPSAGALSAPRLLSERAAYTPALAIGENGFAVAAWASPQGVEVATMPPGQPFGASQQLVTRDPATDPIPYSTTLRAAVNGRGDAIVAWDGGKSAGPTLDGAYRPAGGAFGAPERLADDGGYPFSVAMHPAAVGTIRYTARGGSHVTNHGATGGFTAPTPVGGGFTGELVSSPAGAQAAVWGTSDEARDWREPSSWTRYVASRRADGTFAGPRALTGVLAASQPMAGLDALGNLFLVWGAGRLDGGPLRAATMSRFDQRPTDVTPGAPGQYALPPAAMAVNGSGRVAVAYGGGGTEVLEREPDQAPPVLALQPAARRLGRVAVRVRCSEACRAQATVTTAASRRRARKSRSTRSRPVTLRRRARGRLTTVIPRAERRRLARALRRRGRVRVTLVVRVEDAAGNDRSVRRRLSARRLLR